jgi:dipeptide/tripeptide permease
VASSRHVKGQVIRYHLFEASAYVFPILGGLLSDAFLGKYRTILLLSGLLPGHVAWRS